MHAVEDAERSALRTKELWSGLFFQITRVVVCGLLVMGVICRAQASEVTEPADAGTAANDGQGADNSLWTRASAAWQDARADLAKRGITFSFSYTGEVFYSYKLEPDKVTPYRDETNLRITLDTDKLKAAAA